MGEGLNNELVRYSRAGDAFHYRWAARRCLKMIYPSSPVKYIVIEGSKERKLAGEYIIDISEYFAKGEDENKETNYFQLKHTTVRKEEPFTLSDLKDTITGFADRYKDHIKKKSNDGKIHFYLVTNRPIAEKLKGNIRKLINRQQGDFSLGILPEYKFCWVNMTIWRQLSRRLGKGPEEYCKQDTNGTTL